MEVRDKFLAEEDRLEVPGSDANREFMTQVHEKQLAEGGNPYSNKPLNQKVSEGRRETESWGRSSQSRERPGPLPKQARLVAVGCLLEFGKRRGGGEGGGLHGVMGLC